MKRTVPTLLATTLAVSFAVTACTGKRRGEEQDSAPSDGKVVAMEDVDDSLSKFIEGERTRVLVDAKDAQKGAEAPLVTIVEFSDFQCPFCSKLANTLDEVIKEYPGEVKLVFKQFPLPMHKDADLASQAALAANEQGKHWEMHDKLFANQKALSRADLEKYAQEIGLDVEKFKKALDDGTYKQQVQDDLAAGRKLGVRSTPTFYVNGKMVKGALPPDAIKKVIEEEKAIAKKLIDNGSKPEEIYARIMRVAKDAPPTPSADEQKPQQRPGQPDPNVNYAVPTGEGRPQAGPDDALVTIVEFSDFQCPFCGRVNPTMAQIKQTYPKDVRVVFRQLPLPFHKDAKPAAKAALAAHRQGKFWEMHDKLFANQQQLTTENFQKLAKEIGLDVGKFDKDFADPVLDKMIEEDMAAASAFGVRGTPGFYVNGRLVSGAQPFENFDKVIKEELEKAQKFAAANAGVDRKNIYAAMTKGWETEIKQPPVADLKRRPLDTAGLPAKGAVKGAKVTMVECSDFDCPFCKRATGTIDQIMKDYGDKVAFYFRHYPLPMHKNAEGAHRASVAAGNQGKFWEMHDLLFTDQKARSDEKYEEYAKQIGLDVAKWKKDYADPATATKVKDDTQACAGLDVRGAPGFLINGRLVSGAQPYEAFKAVIEEELAGGFEAKNKAAGDKAVAKREG